MRFISAGTRTCPCLVACATGAGAKRGGAQRQEPPASELPQQPTLLQQYLQQQQQQQQQQAILALQRQMVQQQMHQPQAYGSQLLQHGHPAQGGMMQPQPQPQAAQQHDTQQSALAAHGQPRGGQEQHLLPQLHQQRSLPSSMQRFVADPMQPQPAQGQGHSTGASQPGVPSGAGSAQGTSMAEMARYAPGRGPADLQALVQAREQEQSARQRQHAAMMQQGVMMAQPGMAAAQVPGAAEQAQAQGVAYEQRTSRVLPASMGGPSHGLQQGQAFSGWPVRTGVPGSGGYTPVVGGPSGSPGLVGTGTVPALRHPAHYAQQIAKSQQYISVLQHALKQKAVPVCELLHHAVHAPLPPPGAPDLTV